MRLLTPFAGVLISQREKRSESVHETLPRRAVGCSDIFSLAEFFTGCGGLFEETSMPKFDGKTLQQRFNERYTVNKITGCWNWTAGFNGKGYAYLWVPDEKRNEKRPGKGRTLQAYKLGWIWKNGTVPKGMELHHRCENTRCVNPDHLELLTKANHQRKPDTMCGQNLLKTKCPRGHDYSPENTYVNPKGGRTCRECERQRHRRNKAYNTAYMRIWRKKKLYAL